MDNTTITCYICGSGFDTDEFQVLQPGFELTWKSNLEEQKEKNSPPQGAVVAPIVLPVAPEGDDGMALNVIHLPRELDLRRTRKYGDGHVCEYSRIAGDGKCGLCLNEHEPCNLINESSRCEVCLRIADDCPEDESKSSYLVSKLLKLHRVHRNRPVDPPHVGEFFPKFDGPRPLKAIIFSQFRKKALNVIGDR
jgi:Fe-S oxidoreductase